MEMKLYIYIYNPITSCHIYVIILTPITIVIHTHTNLIS